MAKRRVTFDVDTVRLFDMLQSIGGDTTHIGARVVAALLDAPGFADAAGMCAYGVTVEQNPTRD